VQASSGPPGRSRTIARRQSGRKRGPVGRTQVEAERLADQPLLERSEIRDLADVKALLEAGADLETGLRDAPAKDAGFSPLTLAWVLSGYDPRPAAKALGLSDAGVDELVSFNQWLVDWLTHAATPE
jgi:hypothetical protein